MLHFLFCFVVYLVKSGRTVGPFYISKGTGTGPACTGVDLWFFFLPEQEKHQETTKNDLLFSQTG